MFRCVRGHKLQAILPDALKVNSIEIYHYCFNAQISTKSPRIMTNRTRRMIFFRFILIFIFSSFLNSLKYVRLIIDPRFRFNFNYLSDIFEQHRIQYRRKSSRISFREFPFQLLFFFHDNDSNRSPSFRYNWEKLKNIEFLFCFCFCYRFSNF